MTRILFLDIDGVLLPIGACTDLEVGLVRNSPMAHVDLVASRVSKEAIEAVKYMCEAGAKIVLISSWRYAFTANFILEFLARIGLNELLHDDWFARYRISDYSKRHDITCWLEDHPDVEWIAIDDEDQRLDGNRQIMPQGNKGLRHVDLKVTLDRWKLQALFREQALAEGGE